LERSDLAEEEADDDEDNGADGVAELEFGDLGESLALLDGDLAKDEDEGQGLQDIDDLASRLSIKAEEEVACKVKDVM